MENQVYVAMRYDIRGIYGNVTHCTNLIPIEEFDSNKCIESNIIEENQGLICKAQFSVKARRSDNGEDIFEKWDIKGLPKCLGIDMNDYYKMSQLERIDSLRDSRWEKNRNIEEGIDKLTSVVKEGIDSLVSMANKKTLEWEDGVPIKGGSDNSTKMVMHNKQAKEIIEKIKADKKNKTEK